jgi:hypothetical protein
VGFLVDFVVATPEDALQYGSFIENGEPIPPDRFQVASYKNFMPHALGMLWVVLRHEQWDAEHHDLEHVSHTEGGESWSHTEGGESWLLRFPDEFVHRLSALNEADLHQVADAWVNPREVPGNSDELLPVLQDLKQLATQAEMYGRNLYLWGLL